MFSQVTQVGSIYQLPPPVESLQWCKIPNPNENITGTATNQDEINFDRLLPTLFECFAIVFCGYIAGRCNLISQQDIKGLNDFTTYFSLPPLIFLNLVTINFAHVNWHFVLGALLGKIAVFVLVALVTATVHRPVNLSYAGIYGIFCTQGNDFGLAYPIVASLYGSKRPLYPGYMYLIAPTSLLFTNPMGFFLMEAQKAKVLFKSEEKKDSKDVLYAILRTIGSVSWNVFKNPVVLVTLFGIFGNFLFHDGLPSLLYGILQVLSSAFSAAVLFLLGFSVVRCGNTKSTSKEGLLIPAVLIIAKMIVSPLITRGTVAILCAGAPDVEDLSDYGFLYGMVPTGPIVMLFAGEYGLRTEMMATTMVVCTALFGPVMFILARMLSLNVRGIDDFADELRMTMLVLSIISFLSCVWIGLCFAFGKRLKDHVYKVTLCLMISQAIMAVGIFLWAAFQSDLAWVAFFEVAFIAAGQLMSRLWATILSITLALLLRRPLSRFVRSLSWNFLIGYGIPGVVVLVLLVMTGIGKCQPELHKELPLFIYGASEAIASIVVISICLICTTFSMVGYYRYLAQYRAKLEERRSENGYSSESQNDEEPKNEKEQEGPDTLITGATEAVYKLTNAWSYSPVVGKYSKQTSQDVGQQFEKPSKELQIAETAIGFNGSADNFDKSQTSLDIVSVSSGNNTGSSSESLDEEKINPDHVRSKYLRHVILLILCCISMAVGLTISTWKLSADQHSGLFVAIEFLDAVLNVAQGLFAIIVFWKDSKYIIRPIKKWIIRVRRGLYTISTEPTDDVTSQLCRQFRSYHWSNCQRDLPKNITTEDGTELFGQCFTGREFVDWLMDCGLASHRTAAELYGQKLLRGGVLESVNGAVQFHDSCAYFYRLTSEPSGDIK